MIVLYGPAPQGAGGLKYAGVGVCEDLLGPAPQGAGGLKYDFLRFDSAGSLVPPRKGRVD